MRVVGALFVLSVVVVGACGGGGSQKAAAPKTGGKAGAKGQAGNGSAARGGRHSSGGEGGDDTSSGGSSRGGRAGSKGSSGGTGDTGDSGGAGDDGGGDGGLGARGGTDNGGAGGTSGDGAQSGTGQGGITAGDGGSAGSGGNAGSSFGGNPSAGSGGDSGASASAGTGGDASGGTSTGGSSTGGDASAGASTGGNSTGGSSTGGDASAGTSTGGSSTGGSSTGGSGGDTGGESAGGATGDAGAAGSGAPPDESVTLTVDTAGSSHAISPLIYGMNPGPGAVACAHPDARFTLCRLGGNRWSTYNWETNASNQGQELCFQNDGSLEASNTPGLAVTTLVSEADGAAAAALVTVPMLDYVAADKLGGTAAPDCSGDVRKSGSDFLDTRFHDNHSTKGAPFVTPPSTSDDDVYEDEFVAFVRDSSGSARVLLGLDNQPGLWDFTDEPVHPNEPTYAEVVARNVEYAQMIRGAWPAAEISGYVGYGFLDFWNLQNSPDFGTLGPFADYYLAELAAASGVAGERLIDYFDVHWYSEEHPDGGPRIIDNGASPEAQAVRVQAPRSLWDASYVENTWITSDFTSGQPIRLIPRLKASIDANFPGTKLAISEWSYGGGTDVSGAIAAADALGIFGREDVGLAAWASVTGNDPFVIGAFRVFRNYDGAGAGFGDTSVPATSSDDERVSVYASTDAGDPTRVVIVAINKDDVAVDATLTVSAPYTFVTADLYTLTSAAAAPALASPLSAGAGNAFPYTLPARSVSVIVPKQ